MSSDKNRYYDRNSLDLIETVERKSPVKNKDGSVDTRRKANIGDIKKIGGLPSVTSIIHDVYARSMKLNEYITSNLVKACLTTPFPQMEDSSKFDEYFSRYQEQVVEKASELAEAAAKRGKELHKYVNGWISHGERPEDPVAAKICDALKQYGEEYGIVEFGEEEHLGSAALGFAGSPDITGRTDKGIFIFDLKTTDIRDKKGKLKFVKFSDLYDEWKLQLCSYLLLVKECRREQDFTLVQLIADRNTGETAFIQYEGQEEWSRGFVCLLNLWVLKHGYDPRTWSIT